MKHLVRRALAWLPIRPRILGRLVGFVLAALIVALPLGISSCGSDGGTSIVPPIIPTVSPTVIPTVVPTVAPAQADLVALRSDNTLAFINSQTLQLLGTTPVTGIQGTLIGIDFRPADRQLYGVSDANIVYVINPQNGVATQRSVLSAPFTGGIFSGMDFNPTVDRLRLVGANRQNFRINVDTGEVFQDGLLFFSEPSLQNQSPAITAVAYTNNVPNAGSTQLIALDTNLNRLFLQDPPNAGELRESIGLGINLGVSGFDIRTIGGTDEGFAITDGTLVVINLRTGSGSIPGGVGNIGGGPYIGLAAVL